MSDLQESELRERFADILDCGFEFGSGWNLLVENMFLDMIKALKKAGYSRRVLRINQIKSKFGTLRCYYQVDAPVSLAAIVEHAELLSAHTCETCGGIGRVQAHGWVRCICERCARREQIKFVPLVPDQLPEGLAVRFEKQADEGYKVIVIDPRRPDEPKFKHARAGDVSLAALELMESMLAEGAGPTHATLAVSAAGVTVMKSI